MKPGAVSSRLVKIRGRTTEARQARLEATREWMAERGWVLVDFAATTGQAMFERDPSLAPLRLTDPRRWRPSPGWLSGLLGEWLRPRRLALTAAAIAGIVAMVRLMSAFPLVGPLPPDRSEAGQWWRVTADQLQVREEPLANGRVVGILHHDQRVLVGSERGGWIEVIQPERGFVAREFLASGPAPEAEPEEEGAAADDGER